MPTDQIQGLFQEVLLRGLLTDAEVTSQCGHSSVVARWRQASVGRQKFSTPGGQGQAVCNQDLVPMSWGMVWSSLCSIRYMRLSGRIMSGSLRHLA